MMNEAKKRPFVFLSYAHADKPFVTRLITHLEANNIPIWIDHEGIPPGSSDWEQEIRNAVSAASAILLIASPQARSSRVVRDELAIAKMYKRPIYPLWVSGTDWIDAIPLGWGYTQYIDARDTAYEAAISQLITSLKKTLAVHSTTEEAGLLSLTSTHNIALDNVMPEEHLQPVGITHHTLQDWGEAPSAENFYGRDAESDMLERWILSDNCRVVLLQGIGGIGKTTLAVKVIERVKGEFEYIFWRSLQNALPLKNLLEECILFLSNQQETFFPTDINDQISMLIRYLKGHHCLLVLDNLETILQKKTAPITYRKGYEDYGLLLRRIGTSKHQSCLLLTSREKPGGLASLEGKISPVRVWRLSGLTEAEGRKLLDDLDLHGSNEAWAELIQSYSGNPLYLKIVSELIRETFSGDINKFQEIKGTVPGEIKNPLEEQFSRLSPFEREILYWLAIEREAISFQDLQTDIASPLLTNTLSEVLNSLRRRSLIENGASYFFLQPVVMEYITEELIKSVSREILQADINLFGSHALMKALSKDYVRESQIRLILRPLVEELKQQLDKEKNVRHIRDVLADILVKVRNREYGKTEYAGGNILNLFIQLNCDLSQVDFSGLKIRQAFLQRVKLQDTNFSHVNFVECTFTETFGNVMSVAFSAKNRLFAASGANADIRQWYAERYVPSVTYQGYSGKLLAAATSIGEVRLWDAATGTPLRIFQGHNDWVFSVSFSPDGHLLASGGQDQTVRLWEVSTGRLLKTLTGHTNRVAYVTFNHDGQVLASGGHDGKIRLWRIEEDNWEKSSGNCWKVLDADEKRVWSVAFNPEGTLLASGSENQTIQLWNTETGERLGVLPGHEGFVRSVTFHPRDGDILASGSDDESIRLWNVRTQQPIRVLREHSNRVRAVAFSPDGKQLVSSSDDYTVRLWNVADGKTIRIFEGHTSWVGSVAFSVDGSTIVSSSDDQTVRLWVADTGARLKTLLGYAFLIETVDFHPDGITIASGGDDQQVHLWNRQSGQHVRSLQGHHAWVRCVRFSPDGQTVASCSDDKTIRLWDVKSGRSLKTLSGHTDHVWSIAFHPKNAHMLASCGEDQTIRLWDCSNGQTIKKLRGHESWVWSVAFSPDGSMLASASADQTVRLWDVSTGHLLKGPLKHTNRLWPVAFSPDGAMLATGCEDQNVHIWDVSKGEEMHVLSGHSQHIWSVAFSHDSRKIISGGVDQTIRIWNAHTGELLKVLNEHSNQVRSIVFSPKGKDEVFASGSHDGTIKIWKADDDYQLLKTLRSEPPYAGMKITNAAGLTEAQVATLMTLGAVREEG